MLNCCSELWIVMADGWKESKGIQGEIDIAIESGIGIVYYSYPTLRVHDTI